MMETKGKHIKNDEIDDFAKALLDKKTEIALEDIALKENERITRVRFNDASLDDDDIGTSAFDALNMLRKERGQDPITPESMNETVQIKKPVYEEPIPDWEEEDFTTSSLSRENIMKQSIRSAQRVIKENEANAVQVQTEPVKEEVPVQTQNTSAIPVKEKVPQKEPARQSESKPPKKKIQFKELSKQQLYILIAVVL
ncbi:MAG: hypothetical protein J6E46_08475, partial [Faecalicoccus sp.]|nr:hypothetical protein [Faecalicoccus sp.]